MSVATLASIAPSGDRVDRAPLQRVAAPDDPAAANEAREARLAEVRAGAKLRAELRRRQVRSVLLVVIPPILGIALFVGLWALVSTTSPQLPSPAKTWASAVEVFGNPFYRKGPNDQGIGWNVLMSLQRVGIGFGLAALIGIPLGFVLGRFAFAHAMAAPIISLLRP
jgi:nitrate/nitrite transport system permease protein